MIVTLYHKGNIRVGDDLYLNEYTVLCENGVVFQTREDECYKTGTRLHFPDDMCQLDSGWLFWKCEKDGLEFWTRTRPGGKVVCPMCSNVEECPLDAQMLPWEGADDIDRLKELEEE